MNFFLFNSVGFSFLLNSFRIFSSSFFVLYSLSPWLVLLLLLLLEVGLWHPRGSDFQEDKGKRKKMLLIHCKDQRGIRAKIALHSNTRNNSS